MDKKLLDCTLLKRIFLLAVLYVPLLSQNFQNPEEETWMRNSSYLDCFLAEPITNLPILESVNDLYYWTLVYSEIRGFSFLKELFSNKLLASDVDEAGLDAIFRLLKVYSSPISYEWIKPIISRIIQISSIKTEWFARNLLLRDDWKEIVGLIVKGDFENIIGQRKGIRETLSALGDSEVKKELMDLFMEIEVEEQRDVKYLEEFFKEPEKSLDKIRGIYDLCATMGPVYRENPFDVLVAWITKEPDINKVAILFHFMNHCDGANHIERLEDIAVNFMIKHRTIFISALNSTPSWRAIIYRLNRELYYRDKEFDRTISALGTAEFDMSIRFQLEFLKKHLKY